MTITVRLPMSYRMLGTLHGRVQPRSYHFAEMVDLSIPEVSASDAPLAVSWKVPNGSLHASAPVYRTMWNRDQDQRQRTVFYNGHHWVRMLEEHKDDNPGPSAPVRTTDFVAGAEEGVYNRSLGFVVPNQGRRGFEVVQDDPSSRFAQIEWDGRRYALRRASKLECISVDGILHLRCDQPSFKLIPAMGQKRGSVMGRFPVVDVIEMRVGRSLTPTRISILPISMREEVLRQCFKIEEFSGEPFEMPVVHMPESISDDENLRLEADYLVHEFLAHTHATLGTQYACVERYFQKGSPEEKLEYLLSSEMDWSRFSRHCGISTAPLRRAVEALDGMSISLAGDFLPKGTTAPR